jgi:hypothetical protein
LPRVSPVPLTGPGLRVRVLEDGAETLGVRASRRFISFDVRPP